MALQFGDLTFGADENDSNRFILVQHNYVHRMHTTTRSKKARRVDMSRDLRRILLEVRDQRLLAAYLKGKADITEELVFPSPDGNILDPDNLYHRYFLPVLAAAGIRKIRLHDLRHTFGSQLIQRGATIVYVKEQMGHSSIQSRWTPTATLFLARTSRLSIAKMKLRNWSQPCDKSRNQLQLPRNHPQRPRNHANWPR